MRNKFIRAIFPGSFDPITNGHLDVIKRGIKLFDELIIAVGKSPIKNALFTPQDRVEMIAELVHQKIIAHQKRVFHRFRGDVIGLHHKSA